MSDALLGRWLSTLLTTTETIESIDYVTESNVRQVEMRASDGDRGSEVGEIAVPECGAADRSDRGRKIVTCRPFVG